MPARFVRRQQTISVASGAPLQLTCAPVGDGPLQLTWYRRGHLVTAADGAGPLLVTEPAHGSSQLTVTAARRADGGTYTCVARNDYGEASTTWHVTVTGQYGSQVVSPGSQLC